MNYDIYGNPLRKGFCEVHPWINQEYPCERCLKEQKDYEDMRHAECEYYRKRQEELMRKDNVGTEGEGI